VGDEAVTRPLIIAHRGASAYLPEHSRGAKALAYGMGAAYLEQDVIATRDGQLVVLHDLALDAVADVGERFHGRARADGRHYCRDFDLDELRTLRFHERVDPATRRATYPDRYPPGVGRFGICTLAEEIGFVEHLNQSTGRDVGIYPEIKNPEWHLDNGFDLANAVVDMLDRTDYLGTGKKVYLQCFDRETLRAVRARVGSGLSIIQLLSSRTDVTREMLVDIATYATGIGPSLKLIYRGAGPAGEPMLTSLAHDAHAVGLEVHPYTFRADDLPVGVETLDALVALMVGRVGIDALFTDFTDRVARCLDEVRDTR